MADIFEKIIPFLKSKDSTLILKEKIKGDYVDEIESCYIKVDSGVESVVNIYTAEAKVSTISALNHLNFFGMYYEKGEDSQFYITNGFLLRDAATGELLPDLNIDKTKIMPIVVLVEEIQNKVRKKIINLIGTDEGNLNSSKEGLDTETPKRLYPSDLEVKKKFFNGLTSQNVDMYKYADVRGLVNLEDSAHILIKYKDSPFYTIEDISHKYIMDNKKDIFSQIVRAKFLKSKIEEIERDKEIIREKEIYTILNNRERKTLNLNLKIKGQELSIKVKTGRYDADKSISKYDMLSNDSKTELLKILTNAEMRDLDYKYISSIEYNRSFLYEKEEFDELCI